MSDSERQDPRAVRNELLRAPHRRPVVEWLLARGFVEDGGTLAIAWSTRVGIDRTSLIFWPWEAKDEDSRWEAIIGHHASGMNPRMAFGTCESLEDIQLAYDTVRRLNGYHQPEPERLDG
jgi:hypothetical protein